MEEVSHHYLSLLEVTYDMINENNDTTVKENKNSSRDEIANVNLLTTISHTRRRYRTHVGLLQNTEKETNLLRLTNWTIDWQVLRMKSWILASATEFPPRSYIIYRWRRAVPLQTILVLIKTHIWHPIKMIARQVTRIKSCIYKSATEFPPCSYRIFIPWASRGPSADVYH